MSRDNSEPTEELNGSSDFWADEAAEKIIENDRSPVVKGGVSPSGIPHIGNFNEIIRGHFVRAPLETKGVEGVRQVFTRDDRDPLRKIPSMVADEDGNIVELDEEKKLELEENLGKPLVDVPDPFGCCSSWAEHFGSQIRKSTEDLGIDVEFVSNDQLYRDGEFRTAVEKILENLEESRELLSKYQRTVDEDYVPFMPICQSCGKITATATEYAPESGTVDYICRDVKLGGKHEIEGCGDEGTVSLSEGKLPWRFEWPAQWMILNIGFEPFGKDHAEGSWESGVDISREILNHEPPESLVYEFFLVDGEKMSASKGNTYTVEQLLNFLEPRVLKYFFAKDPRKQRDFRIENLDQLVDEFDRIESVALGETDAADDRERLYADRVYPDLVEEVREDRLRLPYSFAAMVGVTEDEESRLDVLKRSGHLPENATDRQKKDLLDRIDLAVNWASALDNQYHVEVLDETPDVDFDENVVEAFHHLADFIESEDRLADEIQNEIFESAREYDVGVGNFFGEGYELFLGQSSGPKLGPLLAALDREFVVERLKSA
ncbi:MAG: lysine--tRNA ligase [Halobacteria archaeon]